MQTAAAQPTKPRPPRRRAPDRLSHAKTFANELRKSRLREIKERQQHLWTPETRARKRALIQTHAPWTRATGPKTAAGKSASSRNAWKSKGPDPTTKEILAALRDQRLFLRRLQQAHVLVKKNWPGADRMVKDCMETADQVTRRIYAALAAAGMDTAMLDARLLVTRGAGLSMADLITGGAAPLTTQQIEIIEKMVSRRTAGEPVSRILGEREFWSLSFAVTPDTLDPRPDTETLVEAALKAIRAKTQSPAENVRTLDLGTGSGCILIALLTELPHAIGVAVDINPGALAVARANAVRHGVEDRINFRHGSWFDAIEESESFDLIVSNPPYIPDADIESLSREVRNHDPILALSGGTDGLNAYKIILDGLKKHLVCGGRALFEIGQGQEKDLARLVDNSTIRLCDSYYDLGGILRVVEMSHGEK